MGQMRMISKITIRNFQTHKKSELEFTDGVNLIVGSSDNGKSSVIRAFRWLAENRPTGFSFRRWNTPDKSLTAVDVVVDEETVSRKKGTIKNEYAFKDTVFKAIRADVPEPIQEFLNLNQFNLQLQHGKVFLFQDSASDTARLINDVSGISIIDAISKEANYRIRDLRSQEKNLKSTIKDLLAKMGTYSVYVSLKDRIVPLIEENKSLEKKSEDKGEITKNLNDLAQLQRKTKDSESILGSQELLEICTAACHDLSKKRKTLRELKNLISSFESLEPVPEKNLEKIQEKFETLFSGGKSHQEKIDSISDLRGTIRSHDSLYKELVSGSSGLEVMLKEFESLKQELGICPICEKEF